MASQFGTLFRVTTFGESHGQALGCVVDGCPAGLKINEHDVQIFLNRRKPGQNEFTTPRSESDTCEILSGIENSVTLGSPITIMVRNQDKKTQDYSEINSIFRPGHADYSYFIKYGVTAVGGGGRASARETIGRVAAASVAKTFVLSLLPKVEVVAWVDRIHTIQAKVDENIVDLAAVETSHIRCPDVVAETLMKSAILSAKSEGDSLGGIVKCVARHIPAGLGEPVFDKFEADLAKAMLSLPAVRSFEIGEGMSATFLKGSENNDPFATDANGKVVTTTNRSGGVQGGITNGMPIVCSVGFKPVSTIFKEQGTITRNFTETRIKIEKGRHDPCVLPRAVPLVEAMFWLVLADHLLRQIAVKPKFLASN